jgi:hypothetical protein
MSEHVSTKSRNGPSEAKTEVAKRGVAPDNSQPVKESSGATGMQRNLIFRQNRQFKKLR